MFYGNIVKIFWAALHIGKIIDSRLSMEVGIALHSVAYIAYDMADTQYHMVVLFHNFKIARW